MKSLSIIIINRNDSSNLNKCLKYLEYQNFPKNKLEILVIDGNSSDQSEEISKLFDNVKFYNMGYETEMEARRYLGILKCKNEIISFIDTDNFVEDKDYLLQSISPFYSEKYLLGAFSKWYFPSSQISLLDKYYSLIGGNDPIAYYLCRNDRVEFQFDKYPNANTNVIKKTNNYDLVSFDKNDYPVIGCNGFFFSKSIINEYILKDPRDFFHTDYFKFINDKKNNYNYYAILNNSITHNTGKSLIHSLKKRVAYSNRYYLNKNMNRTYKVFNPKKILDLLRMIKLLIFALTLVEPIGRSFFYYFKTRQISWFLHPFVFITMVVSYSLSILLNLISITKKTFFKKN